MKQPQQVQLPAVQLPLTGLKAEYHIIRHNAKLAAHPLDAGMDLYPSEIKKVQILCHHAVIWVHTFLNIHIGPGGRGRVESRSSSLERLNGGMCLPGLIDAGYTGEIMVRVLVPNDQKIIDSVSSAIMACQSQEVAIAQFTFETNLIIVPVILPDEAQRMIAASHGRGDKGFGSTDKIGGNILPLR